MGVSCFAPRRTWPAIRVGIAVIVVVAVFSATRASASSGKPPVAPTVTQATQMLTNALNQVPTNSPAPPIPGELLPPISPGDTVPSAYQLAIEANGVTHPTGISSSAMWLSLPATPTTASANARTSAGRILDPVCRSFFVNDPPMLIYPRAMVGSNPFRVVIGGIADYPGCSGSVKNKALTSRTGRLCLQALEGPGPVLAWRDIDCNQRTFATRSFGSYSLGAGKDCRPSRRPNRFRMRNALMIQRGALRDSKATFNIGKFFECIP